MTSMNSQELLQLLISALIMGSATAYLAKRRGRDATKWFFVGLFFGIFGLLALFFFPKVESKEIVAPPQPPEQIPEKIKDWYYLDAQHVTLGPITRDELNEKCGPRTYVWKQGMNDWTRFEDIEKT